MTNEQWLKYHSTYEKKAFRIIQKALKESINVNWENLTENTYKVAIPLNIDQEKIKEAYFEIYFQIGLIHGKRIGRELQKEIDLEQKDFSLPRFTEIFRNNVANFIDRIAPKRITSVASTFLDYLVNEFGNRLRQGKTIQEIATEMRKLETGRKLYRWQALRIARTETTAAANYGAIVSANDVGVEIQKEWITAEDERVRYRNFDHRIMHGKRVEEYQEFIVPNNQGFGEFLNYPGDPEGSASDVINCRCTVGFVPKRDNNGRLIYK